MTKTAGILIAFITMSLTGCMNDQTAAMAQTCQRLLESRDRAPTSFIEDAEARVALLNKPQNKLMAYARDFQDPGAMKYKSSLENCVLELKYSQPLRSGR